jgi:hypothetical protein
MISFQPAGMTQLNFKPQTSSSKPKLGLGKLVRSLAFESGSRHGPILWNLIIGVSLKLEVWRLKLCRPASRFTHVTYLALLTFVTLLFPAPAPAADRSFGPLLHDFPLTLAEGHRTEAVSPFYYSEEQEGRQTWAVPPFFSHMRDPATDSEEFDFLYPLVTFDRYGSQHRLQFFQLLSFTRTPTQLEKKHEHFTIFPIYFQQRGSDTNNNYTAVVPFYGQLKHRLFRDEIRFVMFPIYSQTRKKDVVTDNYFYPFYHKRHGDGLTGWQAWPFAGREHKDVTTRTNGFGDVETIGGHESHFVFWPFYFDEKNALGTYNPEHLVVSFPFYSSQHSPKRDSTSYLFLFSRVDDREKKYREWDMPWPFVVKARGEGKTTDRIFPFYSRAHNTNRETDFIMWPVYKHYHYVGESLDRERTQILLFGYSHITDKNIQTGAFRSRKDLLPIYNYRRDYNGNTRLQIFSPLEVFVAGSHKIERDYSPLWSVWRSEHNAKTGAASQSLLWNLYRHENTKDTKKSSFLFGLFQSRSTPDGKQAKLFYIPLGKSKPAAP